ncbi:hypothetical protein BJY00DRAFT_89375 [Aspergillus carlsbadensis]|nr:hypothetical protein BJY00DRAFT_89375 [Aspergillus carlsbadensis]
MGIFFLEVSTGNCCGLETGRLLEVGRAPLESPTCAASPRGFSVVDRRTGLRQPNLKLGFTLPFQTLPLQQSSPVILHSLLNFVIAVLCIHSRCSRCSRCSPYYRSCHRPVGLLIADAELFSASVSPTFFTLRLCLILLQTWTLQQTTASLFAFPLPWLFVYIRLDPSSFLPLHLFLTLSHTRTLLPEPEG